MTSLKLEIVQESPFSSLEEEALLNIMRTSDCLHRAFQRETGWQPKVDAQDGIARLYEWLAARQQQEKRKPAQAAAQAVAGAH